MTLEWIGPLPTHDGDLASSLLMSWVGYWSTRDMKGCQVCGSTVILWALNRGFTKQQQWIGWRHPPCRRVAEKCWCVLACTLLLRVADCLGSDSSQCDYSRCRHQCMWEIWTVAMGLAFVALNSANLSAGVAQCLGSKNNVGSMLCLKRTAMIFAAVRSSPCWETTKFKEWSKDKLYGPKWSKVSRYFPFIFSHDADFEAGWTKCE